MGLQQRRKRRKRRKRRRGRKGRKRRKIMENHREHHGTSWIIMELRIENLMPIDND